MTRKQRLSLAEEVAPNPGVGAHPIRHGARWHGDERLHTEVVGDLGTTTSNMQLAIATFTLTMAALMLAGAGLGTRLGLRRTFVIGNVIYAIGSLTTAFAPGFASLFIGWSLVEGLGAALVVPAIAALAAVNYSGRERAMAYAVLGGIAGAASAAGPLIGGWMTTYLSWRWVFGFETLIILLLVLPLHRRIVDQRPTAIQGDLIGPACCSQRCRWG